MATKIYSVRFEPELMDRVDAQDVGRSEFIRDAVEAALGVSSDPVAKINTPKVIPVRKPAPQKKNSIVPPSDEKSEVMTAAPSGRQADAAAVLEVVRSKPQSSRQVEAAMGWMGLRYANAEKLLMRSGAVAVVDGHLVAT